jgi:aspartyl/asparaginyl-tRNA synthetase
MHVPQMDPPHLNRDMGGAMLSEGFDIILPDGFGEVSSGGIRDKDALSLVYKDAPFSISHATTGGFGIGLERLVRFCLGAPWLQDVVLPHLWHDAI